jgi:SAM-dependent methyltransferase
MAFYEELSKYYDHVFPFNPTTYNFLKNRFSGGKKVLDIGTGTGNYSIAFAGDGYDVTAIDLDSEMIEALKDKTSNSDLSISPLVMNMLDLGRLKKDSFDGAFCIGNSLVHLQTAKDIQKSLNEIYALLKIGGQLAIQIVNYDRVLKRDVKDLPLINRPEVQVKFIRKYDLIDGMIHFKTRLIVGDDNKTYDNVITLYPLTSIEFKALLEESGFKNIQFYGGFDGKDFDLDAFPMIVTAQK